MALLVTLPTSARAQAELQEWLNPTLGKLAPRADYRFTYYPDQRVEGQRSDLRVIEHSFSLNTPIAQDDRNEWALSGDARYQDLHNRAILPDTRQRFPDELWDVTFGGSYRHKFENGWIGAGGVTVGSAGDQPFQRRRDVFLRAGDTTVMLIFIGLTLIYLVEIPTRFLSWTTGGRLVGLLQLATGIWLM